MALNQSMGIGFVITGKDLASRQINKVKGNLRGLGKQSEETQQTMESAMKMTAAGIGLLTVGLVGLSAEMKLAGVAGEFEHVMAGVGATARASEAEMKMLKQAAIEAGIATQFSPLEAGRGLKVLAAQGLAASDQVTALIPVLDLAAAGEISVAESAEAAVGAVKAFGMEMTDLTMTADKMMRATTISNLRASEFSITMGRAGAMAKTFGQSLDDTLIGLGALRNMNVQASVATTSYNEAVRRLAVDQAGQREAQRLGVQIFDKQTGKMRSALDIMLDVAEATKDLGDKEKNRALNQMFGVRGIAAFNAIAEINIKTMRDGKEVTLKGAEALKEYRKQMSSAGGASEKFREKLLSTYEGQKTLLKGSIETLAITLGEPLANLFKPGVTFIIEKVNELIKAFQDMDPETKKWVAGIAVAIPVMITVGGAILTIVGAFALLKLAIVAAGITLAGIGMGFVWVTAIIAGLVAAGALLYKAYSENLGGLKDSVGDLGKSFKGLFGALKNIGKAFVENEKIMAALGYAFTGLAWIVGKVFSFIATTIETAVEVIRNIFEGLGLLLEGDFKGFGKKMVRALLSAFTGVGKALAEVFGVEMKDIHSEVDLTITWITEKSLKALVAWKKFRLEFLVSKEGKAAQQLRSDIEKLEKELSTMKTAAELMAEQEKGPTGKRQFAGGPGVSEMPTIMDDFIKEMESAQREQQKMSVPRKRIIHETEEYADYIERGPEMSFERRPVSEEIMQEALGQTAVPEEYRETERQNVKQAMQESMEATVEQLSTQLTDKFLNGISGMSVTMDQYEVGRIVTHGERARQDRELGAGEE